MNTIEESSKSQAKKKPAERGSDGRYLPGTSGNAQGRPLGARNRASLLVEHLLDGQAEALAEKAIEMALAGQVLALRLCLERLLPARRERYMVLELPAPATPQDITAGFGRVAEALANGDLTPSETDSVGAFLEGARRALEATDLARRIYDLENRLREADRHGTER